MRQRGVVLAGGKGTRLGELTRAINKHVLPVGPWPMIYYPIKKLVGAGIEDIVIVSGGEHIGDFVSLLGSGKHLGCDLTYRVQEEPGGIAQALGLVERCGMADRYMVLLGDNIFYQPLTDFVNHIALDDPYAWVYLHRTYAAERFGVAVFNGNDQIVAIEEKPVVPKSELAVTGIYSYPSDVFDVIRTLKPSARGELEITDVNNHYIKERRLKHLEFGFKGYWSDAGSMDSYRHANQLVCDRPPLF